MARPKRSAVAPKQRKRVKPLVFGKYRHKEWEGPKKGYSSLDHGSGKRQEAGLGREFLTSSKDRRARKERAMGKHAGGMLLMIDKKARQKDAKKAVKQVCENTTGKLRRKVNLLPITRKARNAAIKKKGYYGVCHKKKVGKMGGVRHRVLPRKGTYKK
jgi:hypothetical protein